MTRHPMNPECKKTPNAVAIWQDGSGRVSSVCRKHDNRSDAGDAFDGGSRGKAERSAALVGEGWGPCQHPTHQ